MKTLDKEQDKLKKISDALKQETLEPAKKEALALIHEAKERAEKIVASAELEAKSILAEAQKTIEQEKSVFHSSLDQAARQTIEALKQQIEHELFHNVLEKNVVQEMSQETVIAKIITATIQTIEQEGLSKDFSAIVPLAVTKEQMLHALSESVREKLKESILLGPIKGGVQLKLNDKRLTIDISDQTLTDFLTTYLRKDFRKWIFSNSHA